MVLVYLLSKVLSIFKVLMFKLLVGLFSIKMLFGLSISFVSIRWFFFLFDSDLIGVLMCLGVNK